MTHGVISAAGLSLTIEAHTLATTPGEETMQSAPFRFRRWVFLVISNCVGRNQICWNGS